MGYLGKALPSEQQQSDNAVEVCQRGCGCPEELQFVISENPRSLGCLEGALHAFQWASEDKLSSYTPGQEGFGECEVQPGLCNS